MKGRLS